METIKDFTLFWLGGDVQHIRGKDIAKAMTTAGIGAGAIRALDFYADGKYTSFAEWEASNKHAGGA